MVSILRMRIFLSIILVFSATLVFAQDLQSIEAKLHDAFSKIEYHQHSDHEKGSLIKANESFEKMLLEYTSANPETINYDFKELVAAGLTIATSEDSLFRIYSWDTKTGGSMHYFANVFQLKNGKKTFSKRYLKETEDDRPDPGCFYFQINDIKIGKRKYYLAQSQAILATTIFTYTIKTFSINGSRLNDETRIIKTRAG